MKKGAIKNYRFDEKNQWRRLIWDEMLHRTNGREQAETVIYLAGPDDMDRMVARSKGIPSDRLFAVDRDRANVEKIRARKLPAVRGQALDVLKAWPDSAQVCLIYLDLCCGLPSPQELMDYVNVWTFTPSLRDAIFAVNLQRGREAGPANIATSQCEEFLHEVAAQAKSGYASMCGSAKHRGMQFYSWICFHVVGAFYRTQGHYGLSRASNMIASCLAPKPFTYRSGKLVFDSVVLSPFYRWMKFIDPDGRPTDQRKFLKENMDVHAETKLRVNATLAVRTARANQHEEWNAALPLFQ